MAFNYYSAINFVVAAALLLLGRLVFVKRPNNPLNQIFSAMCFTSGCWQLFYALSYNMSSDASAAKLLKIGYCGVVFIAITNFHYAVVFLDLKKLRRIAWGAYVIGIIFCMSIWTTNLFFNGVYKYFWGYYPRAGIMHPLFLVFFIGLLSAAISLYLYFLIWKKALLSPTQQVQIKYLSFAFVIYNIACVDFVPNYGISIYPFGNVFTFLFLAISAYTIIRYHLMDIRVAITRAGIFLTVYTMVLGLPFWIGYQTKSWAWSTSVAVILASLGPLIYRMLQKKAEDTLLAKQRRYQKVLLQAAEGMSREHDLPRLFKLIVYIVKKTVRIKFAAAFSYDFDAEGFVLRAVKDHHMVKEKAVVDEQSVLVTFMHERGHPFLAEEMPATSREMLKRALNLEFALVVPAMMESKMLGFLVLGEKQDKSHYSQDDINVFEILANQAALAIENCMFIAESKKAQERIFAAEKLAAIGGMADGVAHQVKNRLNHFSVASGEMQFEIEDFFKKNVSLVEQNPQLKNTLDYLSKIAESLVGNVKKTDQIIKGILNFARTEETATYFSEFPLQDIITASLDMLVVKHKLAQFPLDYAAGAHDIIYGVKAQLMEAVYNTLDNGYEAIQERMNSITDEQERFAFVPKIRFEHLDRGDKDVLIISDNGIGIKDEDKRKIFAPFFTTKSSYKSGSGIGAYVVKRMVEENHKGKIIFESEYLKGTRFVIELPKKPASQVKPAAPDAA